LDGLLSSVVNVNVNVGWLKKQDTTMADKIAAVENAGQQNDGRTL